MRRNNADMPVYAIAIGAVATLLLIVAIVLVGAATGAISLSVHVVR